MKPHITRLFTQTLLVALLLACVAVLSAHAQWTDIPISSVPGNQEHAHLTPDGMGGAIVVWEQSPLNDMAQRDIYAQHISSSGVLQWGPSGLPICTAANYQGEPWVLADGTGGWIIVWVDARSGGRIYAQRLDANGAPQLASDGVPVSSGPSSPGNIDVMSDDNGGAFVAWADWGPPPTVPGIYAQRLYADGTRWPQDVMIAAVSAGEGSSETQPRIASDGSGGLFITWFDRGTRDIFAQRLNGSGVAQWAAGSLPICLSHAAYYPSIVSVGAGMALLAWRDERTGNADIFGQRIDGNGAPQWAVDGIPIATSSRPNSSSFALIPAGGGMIAWDDGFALDSAKTIHAQRLSPWGAPEWGAGGATVSSAEGNRAGPVLAPDGFGGALVAWRDERNSSTRGDVYAQRLEGSGHGQWAMDGVPVSTLPASQYAIGIAPDETGGGVILFESSEVNGSRLSVARISPDGRTPTQASLVHAEADAARVLLRWFAPDGAGVVVTVYRREAASGWARLATLSPSASGYLDYEDRAIAQGARYGYRLGLRTADGEAYVGETWVDVPGHTALVLHGLRPNPAATEAALGFALPRSGRASLEIYAVDGRRVHSLEFGMLAAGEHLVSLQNLDRWPTGVYLLQLRFGDRSVVTRALVVR